MIKTFTSNIYFFPMLLITCEINILNRMNFRKCHFQARLQDFRWDYGVSGEDSSLYSLQEHCVYFIDVKYNPPHPHHISLGPFPLWSQCSPSCFQSRKGFALEKPKKSPFCQQKNANPNGCHTLKGHGSISVPGPRAPEQEGEVHNSPPGLGCIIYP